MNIKLSVKSVQVQASTRAPAYTDTYADPYILLKYLPLNAVLTSHICEM